LAFGPPSTTIATIVIESVVVGTQLSKHTIIET